ncbi:hypothetical protein RRG08_043192 [Elysia crispata]|uniref:Uncharacterized protein n=1 Tax=Elysia crispata TaxID=231223 RepID=A0AAE0ZJF0_9GAST|nr:hypothetical protein RRG08_043192 [Elysia crispata]
MEGTYFFIAENSPRSSIEQVLGSLIKDVSTPWSIDSLDIDRLSDARLPDQACVHSMEYRFSRDRQTFRSSAT